MRFVFNMSTVEHKIWNKTREPNLISLTKYCIQINSGVTERPFYFANLNEHSIRTSAILIDASEYQRQRLGSPQVNPYSKIQDN